MDVEGRIYINIRLVRYVPTRHIHRHTQMSPVSVLWQIPQFLLIGTSEILSSVTCKSRSTFAPCCMPLCDYNIYMSSRDVGTNDNSLSPPRTALDFFYSQAPKDMRSFTQALNLFTTSLGTWVCIPIVYLANLDENHQVITARATYYLPTDLSP